MTKMPEQTTTAIPMTYEQWTKLSSAERNLAINLTRRLNGNEQYQEILYALPFIIDKDSNDYVLLPLVASGADLYTDWVLTDKNGKVVKNDIKGSDSSLEGEDLEGLGSQFVGSYQRVIPASKVRFNGKPFGSSLKEYQTNQFKRLAGLK